MPKTKIQVKAAITAEILRLHDEGLGPLTISQRVGLHYRTVVRWMYETGTIPRMRPRKSVGFKITRIEAEWGMPIAQVLESFRRKGAGQLAAAEALGLSNTHIRHLCDKLGVPRLGRNNRVQYRPSREQALKASAAHVEKNSHKLTLRGVTKTYTEWAEHLGVARSVFYARVKRGWPEENLLSGESPFEKGTGHGGRRV